MIELLLISAAISFISTIVCLIIDDFRLWRERWGFLCFKNALHRFIKESKVTFDELIISTNELQATCEALGASFRYALQAMDSFSKKQKKMNIGEGRG